MPNKPQMLLWLNDARGIYIPRDFATSFVDRAKSVRGVRDADWEVLEAGPDHEFYWDVWTIVLDNAIITDEHGNQYSVYQEGDCWLVPIGMEWSYEIGGFQWPEDEDEDEDDAEDEAID